MILHRCVQVNDRDQLHDQRALALSVARRGIATSPVQMTRGTKHSVDRIRTALVLDEESKQLAVSVPPEKF